MIEISYRPDLQLTLMRLFDRVTLAEHLRALRSELVTAQDPPLDFIVLIDARRVLDFDLSLPDLIRLGMRVATIYLHHPRPMVVHVLADQDWHSRIIEVFMGFVRLSGRIALTRHRDEASLLQAILPAAQAKVKTLDRLFPRHCLQATFHAP